MPKSKLSDATWLKIQKLYEANIVSGVDIAKKYKTTTSTVRSYAKRHGWIKRSKSERAESVAKRLTSNKAVQVGEAMSVGIATIDCSVESMVAAAVNQDVEDMNLGLINSRKALKKAGDLMDDIVIQSVEDPSQAEQFMKVAARDLKSLVEVTKTSIETIRKIRGLDEAEENKSDLSDWTTEQLRAEIDRIG